MDGFYRLHPEYAEDERSRIIEAFILAGLDKIFQTLDQYEIHYRGECVPVIDDREGWHP